MMLYRVDRVDRVEMMLYLQQRRFPGQGGQGGQGSPYRGLLGTLVVSACTSTKFSQLAIATLLTAISAQLAIATLLTTLPLPRNDLRKSHVKSLNRNSPVHLVHGFLTQKGV